MSAAPPSAITPTSKDVPVAFSTDCASSAGEMIHVCVAGQTSLRPSCREGALTSARAASGSNMPLISLGGVGKHYGAELILENVTFAIERGEHAALVGSNGAGKSTLLRVIAGLEDPDAGSVSIARGLRVTYLPQDPQFEDEHTLYEAMLDVFAEVISAQDRLRVLEHEMAGEDVPDEHIDEYGRLQSYVEHVGYDYRERIQQVLVGLELG